MEISIIEKFYIYNSHKADLEEGKISKEDYIEWTINFNFPCVYTEYQYFPY